VPQAESGGGGVVTQEEVYFARIRSLDAKPELLTLYYNHAVVHHAVHLWAHGILERADAYEAAMIALAKDNTELTKRLIRKTAESTDPPTVVGLHVKEYPAVEIKHTAIWRCLCGKEYPTMAEQIACCRPKDQ
jgi:hypothetical protein